MVLSPVLAPSSLTQRPQGHRQGGKVAQGIVPHTLWPNALRGFFVELGDVCRAYQQRTEPGQLLRGVSDQLAGVLVVLGSAVVLPGWSLIDCCDGVPARRKLWEWQEVAAKSVLSTS